MDSHTFILYPINWHNKVWSPELSPQTGVSDSNRRIVQLFVDEEKVIHPLEGAVSPSLHPGNQISTVRYTIPQYTIAQKVKSQPAAKGLFGLAHPNAGIVKRAFRPDFHTTLLAAITPALFEYSSQAIFEVGITGHKNSKNSAGPEAIFTIKKLTTGLYFLAIKVVKLRSWVSDNNWNTGFWQFNNNNQLTSTFKYHHHSTQTKTQ